MLDKNEIFSAKILIVDDQKANISLLEQMLKNAGYTNVNATTDPHQVAPMHAAQHFDLILLDLQMPDLDGFGVLAHLKTLDPDGYVPVLVVTAQPNHKLRALGSGAKDFISKPFDLMELQTRIYNMLEVRLLYRKLENYNKELEQTVLERTAELRASEARFKNFTELSSDWYWEQDAAGHFTKMSGPVLEMLGIDLLDVSVVQENDKIDQATLLQANIAARKPFLDFAYSRIKPDGSTQYLQVSGEPMFDQSSRFVGYRGIGMELTDRRQADLEQIRFRAAMGAVQEAVLIITRNGARIIDANLTALNLLGYSLTTLRSQTPQALGLAAQAQLAQQFNGLIEHSIAAQKNLSAP
ncbi:MAG: response regulator, partial [Burkholderiaceae bacterium]|nr:response regulator [Burkholderiaceae bacterium]